MDKSFLNVIFGDIAGIDGALYTVKPYDKSIKRFVKNKTHEGGHKMSVPKFPNVPDGYNINDSIAQILTSIAMEEIGLSHIINAEGEKIQYVLGTLEDGQQLPQPPTLQQILEVNDSVKDMLGQVSFSQMFLMGKMQAALNAFQKTPNPPTPSVDTNILVAGGTGTDPTTVGTGNTLVVPFAQPPVVQIGDYVTQDATTLTQFDINATGNYKIRYQLAAYSAVGSPADLNVIAELTSANLGIINTSNLTGDHTVQQNSLTIQLQAGDKVSLVLRKLLDNEQFGVNSQVITFEKVN